MSNKTESFGSLFQKQLKAAIKEQKSQDLRDYVLRNWKLFCSNRSRMELIREELEQRGEYSVGALLDALNVPECVCLRRTPLKELTRPAWNLHKGEMVKAFTQELAKRNNDNLMVIFVSGANAVLMTNMAPGNMDAGPLIRLPLDDNPAYVCSMTDAAAIYDRVFKKQEE